MYLYVIATLLLSVIASATAKTVTVSDNGTLSAYLCHPPDGTIPPNTTLVLNNLTFSLQGQSTNSRFCLVENTSDIAIVASDQLLLDSGQRFVTVGCHSQFAFSFFNVTNLTIMSVVFSACEASVSPEAARYINESNQFLSYLPHELAVALIFNYCYNLKLINVWVFELRTQIYAIIGVNLLGQSEIISESKDELDYSLFTLTVMLYYTDTNITELGSTHSLNVVINTSAFTSTSYRVSLLLAKIIGLGYPSRMPSLWQCSDFGLYVTQQEFNFNVTLDVGQQKCPLFIILTIWIYTSKQLQI